VKTEHQARQRSLVSIEPLREMYTLKAAWLHQTRIYRGWALRLRAVNVDTV